MTPTREEISALANKTGIPQGDHGIYLSHIGIEAFYRAAYAAGQAEMREKGENNANQP